MTRRIMSREALGEWLTTEIQKFEGCEACQFPPVTRLKQGDEDGCNWTTGAIRATSVPPEILRPAARDVVARARELFNVTVV